MEGTGSSEEYYTRERKRMVREQLIGRGIHDHRVLEAMQQVPRHLFVPYEHRHLAYGDGPLPIGNGQTISQPYIVARMTELLHLQGDERVLEVGTGSGYQAAILCWLAREVHTIERFADLGHQAEEVIRQMGFENIHVHIGDGSLGWTPYAPYDAIIVTAAAPQAPRPLLDQLTEGGRMVVPVGSISSQFLEMWERIDDEFHYERVLPVAFVPLLGHFGWNQDPHW